MGRLETLAKKALGPSGPGKPGVDGSTGRRKKGNFQGSTQYTGMPAGVSVKPNTPPKGVSDLAKRKNTGPAKTPLGG